MDIRQDKQQAPQPQQPGQVAQPADGSLKMHGDQLEHPLQEMLGSDESNESNDSNDDGRQARPGQDSRGRQQ